MQMRMMDQILAPGVKNGEEADYSTEMYRIGGDEPQGFGRGVEEYAVDGPFVLNSDGSNLFRHRKNAMKIGAIEKFGFPILDPLGASQGLAFWTVTIGTGVEPDALVAAPVTHFDVTAQSGRAALLDGRHHASVRRG